MINVIVGPPCSGKSTHVRENAKDGDVRVDYDALASALGADGAHQSKGGPRQAAFTARDAVINEILAGTEGDAWIIHTSPDQKKINRYVRAGAQFTVLDPGIDECIRRAGADNRPEGTLDVINKWYENPPVIPQERGTGVDLEIRKAHFEPEDINIEKRSVTGRAVPYGEVANIGDFKERFEPGSIIPDDRGIRLRYEHGETIGVVSDTEDREDGFYITATFADTQRARETLALLQVGALRDFSIGFIPMEGGTRHEDDVVVRTAVDLREVSVVTFPAYAGANVSEVRNESSESKESGDSPMTDAVNAADLAEVRANQEELERRFNLLNTEKEADNAAPQFRSAGSLLKALVAGDETALRAYEGATTADSVVQNGWVGDLTRLVEGATTLYTLFSKGQLPKEGNFIEYSVLKSNTVTVTAQGGEGEDLPLGKLEFENKTAPVDTRGGAVSLSRQAIERSSVNVLDHTFRALAIELGKDVERVTRTAVNAALATRAADAVTVADGDAWEDWQDAIVDAAVKFKANGLSLDALVVSTDVFKRLGGIKAADGRPVFETNGDGSNTVGALRVKTLTGDIFSVTVVLDPLAATGKAYFANVEAVRIYTNPVTRLQDENIINLTKDFSLYQYIAVAPELPVGLVPVTISA